MNELIYAWAVAYHQAGWCVVPAINKVPLVSWKTYQHMRPTLEQVQEWFLEAPEHAQIALVTGKISNVTVIDIDTHREGCARKQTGNCDCQPEDPLSLAVNTGLTVMSTTGSGGKHLFYQYENVGNSVKIAHPQLDIRSDGGIIILPPSKHANGNFYEWDTLLPWSRENITNALPFPTHLKILLQERPKTDWNALVSGVGEGSRNASLAALAGKLVNTFGQEHLNAAWDLLYLWNLHKNKPPLSNTELASTFKSIVRTHYGK